jgi:cytochrome b subunit of formate dehydrogenase
MANDEITVHTERRYSRFAVAVRIEHLILLLSFTILGITGLIQKYPNNVVSDLIFAALGGITNVRLIHHVAAVVLLVLSAYHVIAVLYRLYVQHRAMTMLPGMKDVTDALDVVRYNLGLTKEHPKLPRYNFGEKFEYWALIWGTVVMAITGFMLWNPILTTQILPGQFIPAAKAAHGGEAVLAVLAILVWHLYNVHIKMFNRSIFTGKMTRHQMEEEHALELAQIETGSKRPLPAAEAQRRRERIFLPVAVLLAAFSLLAIFWFVTYETTAIATVPPQEVEVFTPLTPTPMYFRPLITTSSARQSAPSRARCK